LSLDNDLSNKKKVRTYWWKCIKRNLNNISAQKYVKI